MDIIDQMHNNNIIRHMYPFSRNKATNWTPAPEDIDSVSTVSTVSIGPGRWFQEEDITSAQLTSTEFALSSVAYATTERNPPTLNAITIESATLLQPQRINIDQIGDLEQRLLSFGVRIEALELANNMLEERVRVLELSNNELRMHLNNISEE